MLHLTQRLRCEPPRERSVNSASWPHAPANPRSDLRFDAALSGGVRCARYRDWRSHGLQRTALSTTIQSALRSRAFPNGKNGQT